MQVKKIAKARKYLYDSIMRILLQCILIALRLDENKCTLLIIWLKMSVPDEDRCVS